MDTLEKSVENIVLTLNCVKQQLQRINRFQATCVNWHKEHQKKIDNVHTAICSIVERLDQSQERTQNSDVVQETVERIGRENEEMALGKLGAESTRGLVAFMRNATEDQFRILSSREVRKLLPAILSMLEGDSSEDVHLAFAYLYDSIDSFLDDWISQVRTRAPSFKERTCLEGILRALKRVQQSAATGPGETTTLTKQDCEYVSSALHKLLGAVP